MFLKLPFAVSFSVFIYIYIYIYICTYMYICLFIYICQITKFSLKIDHFIQSIKSNYHILRDDIGIGGILVQPPVYASKQPPSLRQLLVRNTITDVKPQCKNRVADKHRCNVCKHCTAANVCINRKAITPEIMSVIQPT